MRTVVVSDLHLGTVSMRALLHEPGAREPLLARVREADHVVLLGDVVELRDLPLRATLERAEPVLRALGDAARGVRVTIVPGNHDHALASSLLDAMALDGDRGVPVETEMAPPSAGALALVAGWLAPAEVRLAYPGIRLRDDVFATHGHYLDCHLTIPTIERLLIAAGERVNGGPPSVRRGAADHEAAVAPVYALAYALAQSPRRRRMIGTGRSVAARDRLLGSRVVFPLAVGLLNRTGLGTFRADLSGPSLRRAGLAAMSAVATALGMDGDTVIFGHTHRSGPWPRDNPHEWRLAGGGRLVNTGSWVHEPSFLGDPPSRENPYWPGTCVTIDGDDPPRLERLLDELPPTGSGP